ncbi:MAG: type 2 isopentenyl-diphosphate Delta-isomerase, partial [Anaerolineae bacterium]|nr:type 2 isopentenyl-diphosphate Delta-isomerase [Anaerolineae bacterium]
TVFASGGLKNGLDIAKSIAMGTTLGGMTSPFLKAAMVSTEKVVKTIELVKRQIQVAMFVAGIDKSEGLSGKINQHP